MFCTFITIRTIYYCTTTIHLESVSRHKVESLRCKLLQTQFLMSLWLQQCRYSCTDIIPFNTQTDRQTDKHEVSEQMLSSAVTDVSKAPAAYGLLCRQHTIRM